jgi:phosphoglycolate phosphatase-like HAD superfamily hydrolase
MAVHAENVYGDHRVMPCPGVPELLQALAASDNVLLGLVTGNTAQTAPLKLAAGGIAPSLFKVGAYGSDHMDRNQLPALAMERATALTKYPFMGQNTVVIGDTPADILCARAGGTTAVIVATGWHAMDTLLPYQPDHLFENFKDTDAVLAALLG